MADVLFVCVRADVERAEALAEMFEAVGISVDGAPSTESDGALGLIIWSNASAASTAFRNTAQRVIETGNALVVCFNDPPLAAEVDFAPMFDLSDWNGDPSDELVDDLFLEVDRRVVHARAMAPADAAPRVVALREDDGPAPDDEVSPAETDYFTHYGADAFAGLPAGGWSTDIGPPDLSAREPLQFRAAQARESALSHGGAIARLMAIVMIVGGGVAVAATSLSPRPSHETAPQNASLSALVTNPAPDTAFVPEPEPYAAFTAPPGGREPASAPAGTI